MDKLFEIVKFTHISAGAISLLSGGIAMWLNKRSKAHRKAGLIYVAGMSTVFLTAIFMSVVTNNVFLFLIGFFSIQLVYTGWRSLYVGRRYSRKIPPQTPDFLLVVIPGLVNGVMIYLGIKNLLKGNTFGSVLILFGVIGWSIAFNHIRKFYKAPKGYNKLTDHLTGMGAGYIAAVTAFFVTNHPAWMPAVLIPNSANLGSLF
jgi:uncharacterized membrane protein